MTACGGSNPTGELALARPALNGAPGYEYSEETPPDGVSAELWDELHAELREVLVRHEADKAVSGVPMGEGSRVDSLELLDSSELTATFRWSYANPGDYDQNSIVGISDITPIGAYFGRSSSGADWAAAEPADGDGNGLITIADISPVGQYYQNTINGYILEYAPLPEENGSWTRAAAVPLSNGEAPQGGGFVSFTYALENPVPDNYYRVRPYFGDAQLDPELGLPGNAVFVPAEDAPLPLDIPADFAASQGLFKDRVELSWSAVELATGYEIFRDSLDAPIATLGAVTNFADSDLPDLALHFYYIRATNSEQASLFSPAAAGFLDNRGDWNTYGHNNLRSRQSPLFCVEESNVLWKHFSLSMLPESSPAFSADGTIYIGSYNDDQGYLYALNPDGSIKWSEFRTGEFLSSPAIGPDGTIYIGSGNRRLFAFNPDGSEKWSYLTDREISSSPAVAPDGTIYFGSVDFNLYAMEPGGSEKWALLTDSAIRGAPSIAENGRIYACTVQGDLWAVTSVGSSPWQFDGDGEANGSPAIGGDGTIYYTTEAGMLYAVNPDGSERWSFDAGQQFSASPAVSTSGNVYVGSWNGTFYAFSAAGDPQWDLELGSEIKGAAAIDGDGTIFVGTAAGEIVALEPSGDEQWRYSAGTELRAAPSIGNNGELFFPGLYGTLFAFGPNPPVAPAAPVDVQASDGSASDMIRVTWSEVYDATGYHIYRDGSTSPLATVGYVTEYDDEGIGDSDPHTYRIRAFNESGESPLSPEDSGFATGIPAGAGDWDMFGADSAHTGRSTLIGPHNASFDWSYPSGFGAFGSLVLDSAGSIYFSIESQGPENTRMISVNAEGDFSWEFQTGMETHGVSPAIAADGTIYVPVSQALYALNPDGEVKWDYALTNAGFGPPTVGPDGRVYVCVVVFSAGKKTVALDPETGEEDWFYPQASLLCAPSIGSGGQVYFTGGGNRAYGLTSDGELIREYGAFGSTDTTVAVQHDPVNGDRIYFVGSDKLEAWDTAGEGTHLWTFIPETGNADGAPAIGADETIYCGGDQLYAIDPQTGLEKWTYPVGGCFDQSMPSIDAAGYIYYNDKFGVLTCLEPDGDLAWDENLGSDAKRSTVVIAPGGRVLTLSENGVLHCYAD